MVRAASPVSSGPTAAMVSPATATSAGRGGSPVPSTSSPPLILRSYMA